ncbi:MAG TPA: NACHT domain-containing protein, partial [Polyangium sp.]|nr:NACHT domain-containing protein [Polyangium sp.]
MVVADIDFGSKPPGDSTPYEITPVLRPFAAASLVYRGIEPKYAEWVDAVGARLEKQGSSDFQKLKTFKGFVAEQAPEIPRAESARQRRLSRLMVGIEDESKIERARQWTREVLLPEDVLPLSVLRAALSRGAADVIEQWQQEKNLGEFGPVVKRLREPWDKEKREDWTTKARAAADATRNEVAGEARSIGLKEFQNAERDAVLCLRKDDPVGTDDPNPFLDKVERIVELRYPNATITRHRVDLPLSGVLEVETNRNGFSDTSLVAALDKPISADIMQMFCVHVERTFRERFPYMRSTIVHRGDVAPRDLRAEAHRNGIMLETVSAYQGLFDLTPYLEWQTNRLSGSEVYPPEMYVDAPASYEVSGNLERTRVGNALKYLWDLIDSPDQRRFALVLGEFGAGKTFLLRELARRMHVEKHPTWPVLVEMHQLEKRHDLAELLGAHFAKADVPGYSFRAFQYLLEEGRIALLFDGFDELADRVTYDTVTAHFNTVLSAAQGGSAKVLLSSRREHFLNDRQVKLALAEHAQKIPGFRLVMLEPFGELHIRQYLSNFLLDDRAANERYALIDDVQDLLGLSHNPRMLGFIARIPEANLRDAKKRGTITAADLYDMLVKDWLDFEHQRSLRITTQQGISRGALGKGVTALALSMWHAKAKEVSVNQIRDVLTEAMRTLDEPALDPNVIAHIFGSASLLVRNTEGRFSFVHRSVMEWLVAREAAQGFMQGAEPALLDVDEMSALMADFFAAMATRKNVVPWAREKLSSHEKGIVIKNATLVLQRLGESLARVDFSGQDLRGRDFTNVDWAGADLRGTNLEG